eukprot:jgi/Chrzof1/13030/Cz07g17090.t1
METYQFTENVILPPEEDPAYDHGNPVLDFIDDSQQNFVPGDMIGTPHKAALTKQDLETLRGAHAVDRLFHTADTGGSYDLYEFGDAYELYANMPGLQPEDVTLDFSRDGLTVTGFRDRSREDEPMTRVDQFFPLPESVDTNAVQASMDAGVLVVRALKQGNVVGPKHHLGTVDQFPDVHGLPSGRFQDVDIAAAVIGAHASGHTGASGGRAVQPLGNDVPIPSKSDVSVDTSRV